MIFRDGFRITNKLVIGHLWNKLYNPDGYKCVPLNGGKTRYWERIWWRFYLDVTDPVPEGE